MGLWNRIFAPRNQIFFKSFFKVSQRTFRCSSLWKIIKNVAKNKEKACSTCVQPITQEGHFQNSILDIWKPGPSLVNITTKKFCMRGNDVKSFSCFWNTKAYLKMHISIFNMLILSSLNIIFSIILLRRSVNHLL